MNPLPSIQVFCYGSLLNRASLGRALAREVGLGALVPARLAGYARTWDGSAEVVVAARPGAPIVARFLDLRATPGAWVNGALVRVTADELVALRERERGYGVHDVSSAVTCAPVSARVLTFAGRLGSASAEGTIVLGEYVALVEAGCAALGAEFLAEFRRTTAPITAPVVAGPYRFVDTAQNARTTWGEPK
jgi:hypothetical protein